MTVSAFDSGRAQRKGNALAHALEDVTRAHGHAVVKRRDPMAAPEAGRTEAISTGSIGLDIATGIGGVPRRYVTEIYGPSVGKTQLAFHVIANALKVNGNCAFLNFGYSDSRVA